MLLNYKNIIICLLLSIGFFSYSNGYAKDAPGIINYQGSNLVLNGQGTRVIFFMKVYEGSLYLETKGTDAEKIINEVSVTAGYEFNKNNSITAASGKNKFKFDIKEQGFAWIADTKIEYRMIKRMKKGSRIMITGYNQKGSQTIDHYSLLGFTKAYNATKKACS